MVVFQPDSGAAALYVYVLKNTHIHANSQIIGLVSRLSLPQQCEAPQASSQEALLIDWRYPRNLQQCALPPVSCFRFQGVDSFTFREESVLTGKFAIKTVHHIEQKQNFKSARSHSNWGLHPVTFFNWTKLNM